MKYDTGQVFDYIVDFSKEHHGLTPTRREIMRGLDIASTSTVTYHLNKLIQQNRIELFNGRIMVPKSAWVYVGDAVIEPIPFHCPTCGGAWAKNDMTITHYRRVL